MARAVLILFLLCFFWITGAPQAKAPKNIQPQTLQSLTWEIFFYGCFENASDLEKWSDSQVHMIKAEIEDKKSFAPLWKPLGYPLPYALENMWGVMGKPVWIYQHENRGCTVSTYAYIDKAEIKQALDLVAKRATEQNLKTDLQMVEHEDRGISVFLLKLDGNAEAKTMKRYIMARTFARRDKGIKTVLYFIATSANLDL